MNFRTSFRDQSFDSVFCNAVLHLQTAPVLRPERRLQRPTIAIVPQRADRLERTKISGSGRGRDRAAVPQPTPQDQALLLGP